MPAPPPPPPPPPLPVQPVAVAGGGSAVSSKTLGIGAVAVVVIAAAIWGVTQFKPKPPANPGPTPPIVNPSPVVNPPPNPPGAIVTPIPKTGPTLATATDPIIGCFHWFNNVAVTIHSNGVIVGGPESGRWWVLNSVTRAYQFDWSATSKPVFTVNISPDQRSLSGLNQYQFPISATRTAGTFGLVGTWNLSNNVPMIVFPNGSFSSATFTGTWRAVDASRGVYSLTWPPLIDSVTLSANAQQITGVNQYGVKISGTRTEPCSAS